MNYMEYASLVDTGWMVTLSDLKAKSFFDYA
jgi:hypothetical protein